eukprot:Anaeramoba_ignava/a221031_43.p1 GENE.a221031_43~~a221031_43.p1  ORF type:complete len:327 (-),score=31.88 a221031_43:114-1094(-)
MLLLDRKISGIIFVLTLLTITLADVNKVTLNTREYENYRRFIIEIPKNATNQNNTFVRPLISSEPDSGNFSVLIHSENVQKFEGERLRKSEGNIPVRFVVSYPDSNTIKIDGKSNEFDQITSYYIMDENKYVFDLYKFANDDNFYSNSVKLLTPIEPTQKSQDTIEKNIVQRPKNIPQKVKKSTGQNTNILAQSIKTASVILSGLIFLIMATYFVLKIYSGKSLFQDIKQLSHPTPKETKKQKVASKPKKQTVKENVDVKDEIDETEINITPPRRRIEKPAIDESAINSMLFDKKEREVRRIMHVKNLNYNEAEMVFNLSHGQLNG